MVEPLDPNELNGLLAADEKVHKEKYPAEETIQNIIRDLFFAEEVEPNNEHGYVRNYKHKDQIMVEYYEIDSQGNWQTAMTRHFKIIEVESD